MLTKLCFIKVSLLIAIQHFMIATRANFKSWVDCKFDGGQVALNANGFSQDC
jgi:hypothetical protein